MYVLYYEHIINSLVAMYNYLFTLVFFLIERRYTDERSSWTESQEALGRREISGV